LTGIIEKRFSRWFCSREWKDWKNVSVPMVSMSEGMNQRSRGWNVLASRNRDIISSLGTLYVATFGTLRKLFISLTDHIIEIKDFSISIACLVLSGSSYRDSAQITSCG
jgi:hypothetical protein